MRRAVLLRSASRALDGADVYDAAYMWARHRWALPFSAVVFGAVAMLAPLAGIDDWPTRVVIGAAAVAVAFAAATDYRVVAQTERGLVLLAASRIRQVATAVVAWLPPDAELAPVGGTLLAKDWQVGDRRYTVARSSDQAMQRMAAAGE